jgi:hypothetical protein
MRKLASVQRILDIQPIEGADRIELCTVLGWQVIVTKSDGFKVGDLAIYIEPDSILPDKPEYEFLRSRKFRIKTIKMRGVMSQGLVLPLSVLPKGQNYAEDYDVTEILGIRKHDPQAEAELKMLAEFESRKKSKLTKFLARYKWYRRIFMRKAAKRKYPEFIKKTDETRLQTMPHILTTAKDQTFTVTEKLDGTSTTMYTVKTKGLFRYKYQFGVCSRNIHLHKPNNSCYWDIAKRYNFKQIMRDLGDIYDDNVVIQGEIIGPSIQKNPYKYQDTELYVFNVILDGERLKYGLMHQLMQAYGIKTVPLLDGEFRLLDTVEDMMQYSQGPSRLHMPTLREGVVIRSNQPESNLSFKVVDREYLLNSESEDDE